jgi:hypothetical protein
MMVSRFGSECERWRDTYRGLGNKLSRVDDGLGTGVMIMRLSYIQYPCYI